MPKDSNRYVSSVRSLRQTRVRPVPNFEKLHRQWEEKLERGKTKMTTVPDEFVLTKSGKKNYNVAPMSDAGATDRVLRSTSAGPVPVARNTVASLHEGTATNKPTSLSDFEFEPDPIALRSILTNTGIVDSLVSASSTGTFAGGAPGAGKMTAGGRHQAMRVPTNLPAMSPAMIAGSRFVNERNSIYVKLVPGGRVMEDGDWRGSLSVRRPAGRVPLRSNAVNMRPANIQAFMANTDYVAGRTRSRFDICADANTTSSSFNCSSFNSPCVAGHGSEFVGPSRRAEVLKQTQNAPNVSPDSEALTNETDVARAITYDDDDDRTFLAENIPSRQQQHEQMKSLKPNTNSLSDFHVKNENDCNAIHTSRTPGRHPAHVRHAESRALTPVGRSYADRYVPDDSGVRSSPSSPWHDNVISGGRDGNGMRSPLSVIGFSPSGGRRARAGRTPAAKKAFQGDDLASAKQAVAALMAVVDKENGAPAISRTETKAVRGLTELDKKPAALTSVGKVVERPSVAKQIETVGFVSSAKQPPAFDGLLVKANSMFDIPAAKEQMMHSASVPSCSFLDDVKAVAEPPVLRTLSQPEVLDLKAPRIGSLEVLKPDVARFDPQQVTESFSSDEENKENCGEMSAEPALTDATYEQLDRRARTLRRRSQLTTDADECDRIVRQLELIRRRQRELAELQSTLSSKLLRCRAVTPVAKTMAKMTAATLEGDGDQPLNLKVTLDDAATAQNSDHNEPLNLKVTSTSVAPASNPDEPATEVFTVNNRVILADITSKFVGQITDDDFIEVPDSPSDSATADGEDPDDNLDGIRPFEPDDPSGFESTPFRAPLVPRRTVGESPVLPSKSLGNLDGYLASLNVSDISEATIALQSPTSGADMSCQSVSSSPENMSSEFTNYRSYRPLLPIDGDWRSDDPIAAMLLEGDEQHFVPIGELSLDQPDT